MLTSTSVFQSASVAGLTQQQFQPCGKPRTLAAIFETEIILKKYINYIKDFFEPKYLNYETRLAQSEILEKLDKILNQESPEFDSEGLSGLITNNGFVMSLISSDAQQANFSAALKGTISELKTGKTKIEVCIVRDSATYMTFFLSIVGAVAYFIMYFNNQEFKKYLIGGFATLIVGTYFSIWFSNRSVRTVQNKFEIFLQKNGLGQVLYSC